MLNCAFKNYTYPKLNNEKGLNAFDYMTGLRLSLIAPNAGIIVALFILSLVKCELSNNL